jgi:hypothetical protein
MKAAAKALQEEGFSPEVIAFVLIKKMGMTKTPTARLLFPPPLGKEKRIRLI